MYDTVLVGKTIYFKNFSESWIILIFVLTTHGLHKLSLAPPGFKDCQCCNTDKKSLPYKDCQVVSVLYWAIGCSCWILNSITGILLIYLTWWYFLLIFCLLYKLKILHSQNSSFSLEILVSFIQNFPIPHAQTPEKASKYF